MSLHKHTSPHPLLVHSTDTRARRFCAIPQVMAIATLDKVFNNLQVFTGVCKIRKGQSCKLLLNTNCKDEVQRTFSAFARSIMKQAEVTDPSHGRTMAACEKILEICEPTYVGEGTAVKHDLLTFVRVGNVVAPVVLAVCAFLLNASRLAGKWGGDILLPRLQHTEDVMLLGLAFVCVVYLFCFCGVSLVMGGEEQEKVAERAEKGGMRKSVSQGSILMAAADILARE